MNIDPALIVECSADGVCSVIHATVMSIVIFATLMGGFAYTTLLERRVVAWFQHRVGPNRVGPKGILQPIADGVKLIFKEDFQPANADRVVYWLAPVIKAVPVLIIVAVIPLGPPLLVWIGGTWYRIPLGLADVNVGVLWILAITSIGTYGVVLAGWASGSKYSTLGGLRSSAQMISYELSMGIGLVVPIILAGSMSMGDIINAQANPALGLGWFVLQNPLAAAIVMIALLAEVNRAPFDMPEAESELSGGYNTEYSGMKFALLFAGEYVGMISASAVVTALFFGGYHWPLPLVEELPLLGPLNFFIKIVLLLSGMVWVRATLPRIRYDRLMAFGWKVMLPLSLAAVAWTSVTVVLGEVLSGDPTAYALVGGAVLGAIIVVVLAVMGIRSMRQPRDPAEALLARDLTDSRSGIGWGLVQVLGALVSPPFLIWEFTVKQWRNMRDFVREMNQRRIEARALTPVAVGAGEGEVGVAQVPADSASRESAAESKAPAPAKDEAAEPASAPDGAGKGPKIVRRTGKSAEGGAEASAGEAPASTGKGPKIVRRAEPSAPAEGESGSGGDDAPKAEDAPKPATGKGPKIVRRVTPTKPPVDQDE